MVDDEHYRSARADRRVGGTIRGGPAGPEKGGTVSDAVNDETTSTARFRAVGAESEAEPLPSSMSADDAAAVEALPAGSALLIAQRGPTAGARFLLDSPRTSAGRRPASDIFLDDSTVSRRHAEFLVADGHVTVRDVGSLNGTYVNRERIEEAVLHAGDEVQIGKFRLTFHPSRRAQAR